MFSAYGLPEKIVSDNEPQFKLREFADFTAKNGIKHIRNAPYHPATNGQAKGLFKHLSELRQAPTNYHLIEIVLFSVVLKNHTPHSHYKVPPMYSLSAVRGEDKAPFAEGNYRAT